MPSPPIEVFLTTIASQPVLRQRQEYILRTLQVKKIPFSSYDLASDETAKRLWRRKAPADKQQLPGILVGGKFPGPFQDFEDAVECGDLDNFLRLKESWDPDIDAEGIQLTATPIGVAGAQTPLEMMPEKFRKEIISQQSSPLRGKAGTPVNKRTDLLDAGNEFSGFGLQGVQVSEAELADLVAELGLEGDEAGDLVKGLSSTSTVTPPLRKEEPKPVARAEEVAPEVKPPAEPAPEVKVIEEVAEETKPVEETVAETKQAEEPPAKAPEEEPKSEPAAPVDAAPEAEVPAKTEPESQPEGSKD